MVAAVYADDLIDRFWSHVDQSAGVDACWPWRGVNPPRHVTFWMGGGVYDRVHRIALAIKLGRAIRSGMDSCHTCDYPPCCNPSHLFEGTPGDNARDMVTKGRHRYVLPTVKFGEDHPGSKLTERQVVQIKLRLNESPAALGREFGVSRKAIVKIVKGETWKNVLP